MASMVRNLTLLCALALFAICICMTALEAVLTCLTNGGHTPTNSSDICGAFTEVAKCVKENNEADETGLLQVGMHGTKAIGSHGSSGNLQTAMGNRIVNGSVVQNVSEKYPFFAVPTASIGDDHWSGCGATIISPTYALSAAHCYAKEPPPTAGYPNTPITNVSLWLGDVLHESVYQNFSCPLCSGNVSGLLSGNPHGRFARINAKVHVHPLFDGHCSHGHDMALLELQDALPNWVTPVRINLDGAGSDKPGEQGTIMGFGLTESSSDPTAMSHYPPRRLREAKFAIFPDTDPSCQSVYAGGYGCTTLGAQGAAINIAQQLCAGSNDGANIGVGESGTPFLDNTGVQDGLVSYGGGPGGKSGPGSTGNDPNYKNIYTRVSAFSDFIKARVTDLPQKMPSLDVEVEVEVAAQEPKMPSVKVDVEVAVQEPKVPSLDVDVEVPVQEP